MTTYLTDQVISMKANVNKDTITFSEFSQGTSISNQYLNYGILFGGDSPFITSDDSNSTSPVLSGTPIFNGAIEGIFVDPSDGKTSIFVQSITLDAGYFNEIGSTRIEWFDAKDTKLGQRANSQIGIESFTLKGGNIARWRISIFKDEPSGYAIDNVTIGSAQASILFRETRENEKDGSWGFGNDEIPGWDHTAFQMDNLVYESHPGYPTGTYISDDGKESAFVREYNGVQAQHTKATFRHESTDAISPLKEIEEIPVDRPLAEKMKQAIETQLAGSAEFSFFNISSIDGFKETLAPEVQKGGLLANGKKGFTCVGLVEWSAEQAGKNEGQGFIPNSFEKIPKLGLPTLSPQLLNYFMKASKIATDTINVANDIKEWFQGVFDPVDFLITDPLGRRVGYNKKLGELNEIPKAFYSGNGKLEQFFIPNPVPGVYTIQLVGLGQKVVGGVATKQRSQGVIEEMLALGETKNVILTIEAVTSAPGDVNKDGVINNLDVSKLNSMLKTFTDNPNDPGDLDGDGVLSTADIALLEKLVSSLDEEQAPKANAGDNQTVALGNTVTLNASRSYDPDNKPSSLTYMWAQSGGANVRLNNQNTISPNFTPTSKGTYEFTLVVNDGKNNSKLDTVDITVGGTDKEPRPSPIITLNNTTLYLQLIAGSKIEYNADWWVVAATPSGHWYYYVYPNQWIDGGTDLTQLSPAYQGQLFDLAAFELVNTSNVPSGTYTVYFGVDTKMNGLLDFDYLDYSAFELKVP